MKEVWKYPLRLLDGQQVVKMPTGAEVLSVGIQGSTPTIWAEVDPAAKMEPRYFQVHGTGHPISNGGVFVGTAVGVPFVWHVYEHAIEHKN